ncbi:MAG: hypothetical protein P1V20_25195 [Verrucomicrobiales bacterium]|nr:hypothetical protein [Verrucomicrobiales bacterium]
MKVKEVEMAFRGARDYLHGTDLYDAVVSSSDDPCSAMSDFYINFHSKLVKQPDIVWDVPADRMKDSSFRVEFGCQIQGAERKGAIFESDRSISDRRECNEKKVVESAQIDLENRTGILVVPADARPIESVVFLNKHLNSLVLPHIKAPWLFTKIELSQMLPENTIKNLELKLSQVLGDRLGRSEIIVDGASVGHITFLTAS